MTLENGDSSRKTYEENEANIEMSIDGGARAAELAPKFAEQETLKNEAWDAAIQENKERDVAAADELLQSMQSKVESHPQVASEKTLAEQLPANMDDELQRFADSYVDKSLRGDFGVGRWRGEDRKKFVADQLVANDRELEDKKLSSLGLGVSGAAALGVNAAFLAEVGGLSGLTAFGLGTVAVTGGLGVLGLGATGYYLYKRFRNSGAKKQFSKKFGVEGTKLAVT